jgi:hypothetical protein
MHKIPIGGDAMGLVFTAGVLAMIFIALPEARWFLALSLPIGVGIAIILRLTHRG